MAYSATVVADPSGSPLTFTDTSTISGSLVTKILVITDANGVVLATISMGALTTVTYGITADQYLTFTMTLTDSSGAHIVTVNFLSTTFYEIAFVNVIAQQGCSCNCSYDSNINRAQNFKFAADYFALYGLGVAANNNILAANTFINS